MKLKWKLAEFVTSENSYMLLDWRRKRFIIKQEKNKHWRLLENIYDMVPAVWGLKEFGMRTAKRKHYLHSRRILRRKKHIKVPIRLLVLNFLSPLVIE